MASLSLLSSASCTELFFLIFFFYTVEFVYVWLRKVGENDNQWMRGSEELGSFMLTSNHSVRVNGMV